MKKISLFLVIAIVIALVNQIYAQDRERRGGLIVATGATLTETVKALTQPIIKDPEGRQTGFDFSKGIFLEEIPNTDCGDERIDNLSTGEPGHETWACYLFTPLDGIYKVSILGTGSGKYFLDIFAYDINEKSSVQKFSDTTYTGKIDNYEITYSSALNSQVKAAFTGSSEIPVFDGKGQRPTDVNKFLQYFNPTQVRTKLPASTSSFNLGIIYGNTIKRETFKAELNGKDITSQFDPLSGKLEVVKLSLVQGSNTLVLSIKGAKADGKIGEDTDRLTFIVP